MTSSSHMLAICALLLASLLGCCPHQFSDNEVRQSAVQSSIPEVGNPAADRLGSGPKGADYVKGIQNFGFVTRDVWRGGPPEPRAMKTLAKMGVKTIIDLREDGEKCYCEASLARELGMKYVPIRTPNYCASSVDYSAVLLNIRAGEKPVYIHCQQGRDRTGLAVAAYRLAEGMSAGAAIKELHQYHVNWWWRPFIESKIVHIPVDELPILPPAGQPAAATTH